jgi:hypothetical protein
MRNNQSKIASGSQKGYREKFVGSEEFMAKDHQQRERDRQIVDAYRQEFGDFQGFTSIKFDSGIAGAKKT